MLEFADITGVMFCMLCTDDGQLLCHFLNPAQKSASTVLILYVYNC